MSRSTFFGLQYDAIFLVKRYKDILTEIFNLSYLGHLGGIRDILDLTINDRIILLDILFKTKKNEEERDK